MSDMSDLKTIGKSSIIKASGSLKTSDGDYSHTIEA